MIPEITVYGDVTLADILVVATTLLVAIILAKVVSLNLRRALSDKVKKDQLEMLTRATTAIIFIIAFLSVLPILGLNLSGLLVAGGIAGIVIGLC